MTFSGDPYRTLGLVPGASLDDVKRAYRRLAKQYHPDAAGPDAVARFLAIQGAYEALADPALRGRTQGRAASRASEADPDRARATREAYRAGRSAGWGSRAGAGPARADDPWRRGTRRDAGGASSEDQGARAKGTPGTGTEAAGTGGTPGAGRRPSGDRAAGRKPSRRKATLSSTSYDDAAQEPRHPEWQGSSWYGTSSGTYWTINPREYADPRKHGPEYQARARRAAEGTRPGPEPVRPDRPPSEADPRPDPGPEPATSPSASFATAGAPDAWSDAGHGASPWPSAPASADRPDAASGPAQAGDVASRLPTAGSIGLLSGALAAIPASVVVLGSMMSGDLSLTAAALVAPFVVAIVAGLAAGLVRRPPS